MPLPTPCHTTISEKSVLNQTRASVLQEKHHKKGRFLGPRPQQRPIGHLLLPILGKRLQRQCAAKRNRGGSAIADAVFMPIFFNKKLLQ